LVGGGCCCRCVPAAAPATFLAAPAVVAVAPLVLEVGLFDGPAVPAAATREGLEGGSSSAFRLTPATVLGGNGSSISSVSVWSFLGSLRLSVPVVVVPILLFPKNAVAE
jgi:hypothetical protein